VQHLRLRGEIDAASKVDAKGVAHRRRLSLVTIFGESYDPATTRSLRVPPASPTPGAPRDRPSASQVPHRQQDLRHVPARTLQRPALPRQLRQRPRRAVRLDGLLRSRRRRGLPSRRGGRRRRRPRGRGRGRRYDLRRVLRSRDDDEAASSPCVPRRPVRRATAPRVAGTSSTSRSPARSRPRSASSRR
jgi:hypothetical protein